jgi:transposase
MCVLHRYLAAFTHFYVRWKQSSWHTPFVIAPRITHLDLNAMDADALKALILSQQQQLLSKDEQLLSREHEIEHLKLLIAKLQRMQFGRKSEKVERQIEQLELKLEELETSRAEHEQAQECAPAPSTPRAASAKRRPARRPLPEHLLRITRVHDPAHQTCPECGGALHKLGEDVAEVLDYIPASFVVIRHVRPKLSCCGCQQLT